MAYVSSADTNRTMIYFLTYTVCTDSKKWNAVRLTLVVFFSGVVVACSDPVLEPQPPLELMSPAGAGSAQPHLAVGPDGAVVFSWLEPNAGDYALRFSALTESTWSQTKTLASGSGWFVNWADFPSVVPIRGDLWAAHWLVTQEDGFGYDVVLSTSDDAGASWSEPIPLHLDGTPTEHGFVTLFPWQDGIGTVWLDGRNFIQDGEFVFETASGEPLGMSLRYALFDSDGGRILAEELDALVCDCCQTDVAFSGRDALLVYRDRTTEEVRDIVLQRVSSDGWEAPSVLHADNWAIGGCPINGPAIDAQGDHVAVAWFSAVNDDPVVHLSQSEDGGRTFSESIEIDTVGSFGHVDVAALGSGDTVVSWLRSEEDGLGLMMRVVRRSGELTGPVTIASIDIARPLDFPQMVYDGARLIFAWTDFGDVERVRTAVVELAP